MIYDLNRIATEGSAQDLVFSILFSSFSWGQAPKPPGLAALKQSLKIKEKRGLKKRGRGVKGERGGEREG
jgi:hypothetical protein